MTDGEACELRKELQIIKAKLDAILSVMDKPKQ